MNALQRWQARSKENGRLFRLLPNEVQEKFLRQEWRLTWWSWLTIAVPCLALSVIMALVVVALAVFFGAVYDPADPEGGLAGASMLAEAFPDILAEGVSLVIFGPIYAVLWALPAAMMPYYARQGWVRRWHRDNKTGEVPEAVPSSPIATRLKAWWKSLPAE